MLIGSRICYVPSLYSNMDIQHILFYIHNSMFNQLLNVTDIQVGGMLAYWKYDISATSKCGF